jgi:hypothetical protein
MFAFRSVREVVSQLSQFLLFPRAFNLCDYCSELFTHRRDLLCELLQRQSVRTRHHIHAFHFGE